MRADSKLLNPSNETNQYSSSSNYNQLFNKQYEGVTAFNEQVDNNLQHVRATGGNVQDDLLKGVGEDLEMSSKALNKLSTDMAFDDLVIKGTELEALRLRETTNEKDKNRQNALGQEIAMWKKNLVEIKPLITSTVKGIVEGHYNKDLSFKNDLEVGPVLKQWLDPKVDHDKLGIGTFFNKNGEMYITYTPGQVFKSEYENNQQSLNFDPRVEAKEETAKKQIENESEEKKIKKNMVQQPLGYKRNNNPGSVYCKFEKRKISKNGKCFIVSLLVF